MKLLGWFALCVNGVFVGMLAGAAGGGVLFGALAGFFSVLLCTVGQELIDKGEREGE